MSRNAQYAEPQFDAPHGQGDPGPSVDQVESARPLPRISVQAFCETPDVATLMQNAGADRRLSRCQMSVQMGGVAAAIAHFSENPTPNLIILESMAGGSHLLSDLDSLAESCDAGTKVVVIGRANDVMLYRDLIRRGVSEYLVMPFSTLEFMDALSSLYNDPSAEPVGRVYSFVGAKGGVGSSTVCHNVAWAMSEQLQKNVAIADFDLAFGTAGLDFNQDPVQGLGDAVMAPDRVDEVLLDRLLTSCSTYLSLMAAPATLERDYEITTQGAETVIDAVRYSVPYIALDLPHSWSAWKKRALLLSDEIVITAAPDLANLRNTKHLIDLFKSERENDPPPHLVINTANMPRRPEISINEFQSALGLEALAVIDFDCEVFGQAANNGQMIEEFDPRAKSVPTFRKIGQAISRQVSTESDEEAGGSSFSILEKIGLLR